MLHITNVDNNKNTCYRINRSHYGTVCRDHILCQINVDDDLGENSSTVKGNCASNSETNF
jgi:hypothetical protein